MKCFCNPINVPYHYQFNADPRNGGKLSIGREAADPSLIEYHGKYYIFPSMNLGCWVSEDLVNWKEFSYPDNLPAYDYAPDVRVLNDYIYFCASSRDYSCSHFRTKDPINGPYEEIPGEFPFWDPNLFVDDDGRVYFYWGCDAMNPIWGVEKDPVTLKNIGDPKPLIFGDPWHIGYERVGNDHSTEPKDDEEVEQILNGYLQSQGMSIDMIAPEMASMMKGMFASRPFIEGAWMDKFNGKYYLQYAFPGTEYNIYGDSCYVGDSPLGPFVLAKNAPYSYNPGGFMPGAGHGSTLRDLSNNLWHTASMGISVNFGFERRVGLWPAGIDSEGNLFCNQRFATWPIAVSGERDDPWSEPIYNLMNYNAKSTASSEADGCPAANVTNEDCHNWWKANGNEPGEWVEVDMGRPKDVRAIQINFADDHLEIPCPGEITGSLVQPRYIDQIQNIRWKLEGSLDGQNYIVIEDKSNAVTDLPHDFIVREDGIRVRYLRLTVIKTPYDQPATVSGIRVFGIGDGEKPDKPCFKAKRISPRNMEIEIEPVNGADGYNILWGSSPEKLYHSWMLMGETIKNIGALVEGRTYYVRVDSFNENGVTEGIVIENVI